MPDGTHMHLDMSKIREAEFVHTTNDRGLPYVSAMATRLRRQPGMRIYLRKSGNDATSPPRHEFFMSLLEKYPGGHRVICRRLRCVRRAPLTLPSRLFPGL